MIYSCVRLQTNRIEFYRISRARSSFQVDCMLKMYIVFCKKGELVYVPSVIILYLCFQFLRIFLFIRNIIWIIRMSRRNRLSLSNEIWTSKDGSILRRKASYSYDISGNDFLIKPTTFRLSRWVRNVSTILY